MISQKAPSLEVYTLENARRVKKRLPLPRKCSSPPRLFGWELTTHSITETMHLPKVMKKPPEQSVVKVPSAAKFPCPPLLPILSRQKCLLHRHTYLPQLLQSETSSSQSRRPSPMLRPTRTRSLEQLGGQKVDSKSALSRLVQLPNP